MMAANARQPAIRSLPGLERRRPDFTPDAFFFVARLPFVFRRSSFDSRIASASCAFARCLISRSSPVSAIVSDLAFNYCFGDAVDAHSTVAQVLPR